MPGRKFNTPTYRYSFNGKESDNETVGTSGGTQDYGLRIYNPSLGKFLSVDPLFREYPWYSPYHFAGNMPIVAIDKDGAEPEVVNGAVNTLVISIEGYEGSPPPKGQTQTKNNPYYKYDKGSTVTLEEENTIPTLKIVRFSSSKDIDAGPNEGDNYTVNDAKETILNYRKNNPHGMVILIGHSLGGYNVIDLASENPDLKIDMLITIDIAGNRWWDPDIITPNVPYAINYYNENPWGGLGGEMTRLAADNIVSKIVNVPVANTSHGTIDNDVTQKYLKSAIFKIGQSRVQEICPAYELNQQGDENNNNRAPENG
jgi:RHS repeat-associated protein